MAFGCCKLNFKNKQILSLARVDISLMFLKKKRRLDKRYKKINNEKKRTCYSKTIFNISLFCKNINGKKTNYNNTIL